jgi:hypothetical protein
MVRRSDVLIGLALAVLLVGPAAIRGELAGSAGAEVYGHAWVRWWAAAQWPAWPTGTSLAEGTASWPVIDPLPTWILGGLARLIGDVAAWNLGVAGAVVLAAVGGGALARAMGGVGAVGAVGLATAPIFLGSLTSGLTEDQGLGLVALALAAMLSRRPVLGGLLLGLSASFGLYLAWLGAWPALAIGVARVREAPLRWLAAGLLAVALAAPAAAPFASRLQGVGHHAGTAIARPEPLWRVNPWRGADLASFVAPGKPDTDGAFVREHPAYLGFTTLALAAAGGWHPAWLGVLACVATAPGEDLSAAGTPLGVKNPADRLFSLLPFAARFNHHARILLLGQMLLVALAARGAARSRFGRFAPWLLLAETALISPARIPLPGAPTESPAIYARLAELPDGPVSVRGAAGPGVHPQRVFFDQRAHGRRLLHNPNRPMDGEPRPGSIFVALGDARARSETQLGPPAVATGDGAAWVIPP